MTPSKNQWYPSSFSGGLNAPFGARCFMTCLEDNMPDVNAFAS